MQKVLKYAIDFFLNNQPDAVRMELQCSSILTLLGGGYQNLHETYQCRMYSGKLLMTGKEDARNM
jgi:hypothetical protein